MINPFAIQRQKIGRTQRSIADELGITAQCVSAWETGKAIPDPSDYDRVASAYGRNRSWIVEAVIALATIRSAEPVAA